MWNEANKLSSNLPGTSAADLLTFGWLGLRVALRQFDPSLGFQFSTFGVPKINGAMRDGVRSEHWLPKRLTTFVRKVTAADEELANKLGRSPTLPELAEHLGEDFEQLKIIPRLANSASFEELALVNGGERDEISALCDATSDPADMALAAARNEAVRSAVERLPDEEAEVARLLWLEEFSPAEVRELCGLNARQFRARRDRAQEHLVSALAEWRSVAS